ncbi:penicillin acylase family protein [Kiloniella antarctica]|uniref:Penicillin acylase family protein n=1 Tax=Kiloniella antarctica TaxID=1550907 RepID=A0ABW5BRZ7_9PROT
MRRFNLILALPLLLNNGMRMNRILKTSVKVFSFIILLVLIVGVGGFVWLRSSLPQLDGEVALGALKGNTEILRSDDGLVTIRAGNEADAYHALGYVHAQDRLWQMDFMRRAGAGRLSEVSGKATIGIDRFMRTLGFQNLVIENYKHLPSKVKAVFESYSQGVNDYLQTHSGTLSPEFHILNYSPEPWLPTDSLLWGRLMALQLSDNFNKELLRQRLLNNMDLYEVNNLWPEDNNDPLIIPNITGLDFSKPESLSPNIPAGPLPLPWSLAPKDASNAWVLSGDKTSTGGPILANDPHLALDAPGPWYLARIETPEFIWAGATSPGVPLLVLGHNNHIAWGFTTTHSDTQDLFIEKINPDNPEQYLSPEGYVEFETHTEIIRIKGAPDEKITIRKSRHGPIISPVLGSSGIGQQEQIKHPPQIALQWTALKEDDKTAQALFDINRSKDWVDFERATQNFYSPQQTLVMADKKGTIAVIASGRIPIRKSGDGRLPVPGWTGTNDWQGIIPPRFLPKSINPTTGKLVTANNKLIGPDYPYLITKDWPNSYRAKRIHQLIDQKDRLSIEDNMNIQMDTLSLAALELLPLLLKTSPNSQEAQKALSLLRQWNGKMELTSIEPVIFHNWLYWLNKAAFGNLPTDAASFQTPDILRLKFLLERNPENWCKYGERLVIGENCVAQMTESLDRVISNSNDFNAISSWPNWGDRHKAHFEHPIYDKIPLLNQVLKLEISSAGSHDTINRSSPSLRKAILQLFPNVHGPSYRAVYDLTNLDNSRFLLATGQSGNPLSSFYGNFLSSWRDGEYIKLDSDKFRNPKHRLVLIPKMN